MNDSSGLPFVAGSQTSESAAEGAKVAAPTQRERVYQFIKERGPVCDEEIQIGLGMNPNTQRPRRVELERSGRICAADIQVFTKAGFAAVAWVIT